MISSKQNSSLNFWFLLEHCPASFGPWTQFHVSEHIWRSWSRHCATACSCLCTHGQEENDGRLLRHSRNGESCYLSSMAQRHPHVSVRSQPEPPDLSTISEAIWAQIIRDGSCSCPKGPGLGIEKLKNSSKQDVSSIRLVEIKARDSLVLLRDARSLLKTMPFCSIGYSFRSCAGMTE